MHAAVWIKRIVILWKIPEYAVYTRLEEEKKKEEVYPTQQGLEDP